MNEFLDVIEAMDEDRLRLQARIKRQRHELRRLNARVRLLSFENNSIRKRQLSNREREQCRALVREWKDVGEAAERDRDIWFKAASDRLLELTQVKQRLADAERQVTELQAKLYGAGI